ncbi:MAG TPA: DUF222 domain-containing protein [Microbacteriaceae bacterium]|nr:DUF222 domain-containing protein [Microbacteriaceae bacterium]
MKPTNAGDASPAELARLEAHRSRLLRLQVEDGARYAEEAKILHEASQLAGEVAVRCGPNGRSSEMAFRSIAAEFAAALRVSDRTVQRRMAAAEALVRDFPGTLAAVREGRVFRGHVGVIVDEGAHLPDAESRAVYEDSVIPFAECEAPSRLRPFARMVAERLQPRSLKERHEGAAARRGVWVTELPDGMSELLAIIPTVVANGIMDRLNQFVEHTEAAGMNGGTRRGSMSSPGGRDGAGAGTGAGDADRAPAGVRVAWHEGDGEGLGSEPLPDTRTKDQRRADAFGDLGLTGDPAAHLGPAGIGSIRARVQLQVPVLSLLGHGGAPATLTGMAPVDADTARLLAGTAPGWDRVLTHPITGVVLAVDRYTPSVELKRTLRVRDQHCRFPGCRQSAHRTDLDHTIDFALGGQTREDNLAHLCRRHHTLKHATAWSVVQQPGGILEWTSPAGHRYPDIPTSSVMFRPDADWNRAFAHANAGNTAESDAEDRVPPSGAADDPPPF